MKTFPNVSAILRRYGISALVIIAGAVIGAAAAPRQAEASATNPLRLDGWTCQGTDRCHAGEKTCCEDPDSDPDLDHCTTMCNGCNPAC